MRASRRLLVVDDDEDILESYGALLTCAGYEVATAENGRVALEKLRDGVRPDLILLDLMMPIMNGWELRTALLSDPKLAVIPVVVFSGDHRALARTPPNAVAAVLRKPVEVDNLLGTIERCST